MYDSRNHFHFSLPGQPLGWARARRSGSRYFKDAQTKAYQESMAFMARQAMGSRPLMRGPVGCAFYAFFEPPRSLSAKRRQALIDARVHTVKPDADNILKMKDGLNGVVWVDDNQVTEEHCFKAYDAKARLFVSIWEVFLNG